MSVKITKTATPPPAFTRLRDVTPPVGDGSDDGRAWVYNPVTGKMEPGAVPASVSGLTDGVMPYVSGGALVDSGFRYILYGPVDILWPTASTVGVGPDAGWTSSGTSSFYAGPSAGRGNSGDLVLGLGASAARVNSGDELMALGTFAGYGN